jgi:hypothetical protein
MSDIPEATSSAYSELGPAIPSSRDIVPSSMKRPDNRLLKAVMELGLRYRPLGAADQEAHTAQVALLAKDLAGVDPDKLTRAAQEYARTERFMPKACDLLAIINRAKSNNADSEDNLKRLAAKYNCAEWMRDDLQWVVVGTELKLERR